MNRHRRGFTLLELLVAVAVFAALAVAAWGGLASIARTRAALAARQDRFKAITRAVSALERDLRQAVDRPVRGNDGHPLPALAGTAASIEFSHLGFANPRAEPRSHLQRVVYWLDGNTLRRGRYAVLDRAPNSVLVTDVLLSDTGDWRLRYLGCDGAWRDAWPPSELPPCAGTSALDALPRAVEFRLVIADPGEIRRVVELPSSQAGL
jgi:general secretion pathway protein J